MVYRTAILLVLLSLAACDIPPSHDALYPPHEAELGQHYIITHDRYHPWAFQPSDEYGGR